MSDIEPLRNQSRMGLGISLKMRREWDRLDKSPESEKRLNNLGMEPARELRRMWRRTGVDLRYWKQGVHTAVKAW